jgi:ribonuclease Y
VGAIIGTAVGVGIAFRIAGAKNRKLTAEHENYVLRAKADATQIVADAKSEAVKLKEQAQSELAKERAEAKELEKQQIRRQEEIQRDFQKLRGEQQQIEQDRKELDRQRQSVKDKDAQVQKVLEEQKETLYRIAGINKEEAVRMIVEKVAAEAEREKAELIRKRVEAAKEEADTQSKRIISMAIHRFAAPHTVESVVSLIDVPNEEMKGRIIGREGRNIRAFERETGVDVIIDDTPGTISLSAFDGVRREIARRSMEKLIADGRIHPARIEEVIENGKREMENEIGRIGKQFLFEQDIHNVHPKLITLLGRLQFRTSYGQNVLQHIREVAHVCSVMAAELGMDAKLAKRCGIFHDIGKAVDHTFEGSHPQIGGDLLRRFGESPEVIEAAEHHHSDQETVKFPTTVLAAAADAISASRPGARGETVENYMRRVEKLEGLAKQFPGVVQAFAVYAGRELRVIVSSDQVSDDQALVLARDIAKSIEEQLTYPGEIKVTVMRERRITEYAR